ncbi:hypothetical protein F4678DRAFT_464470 [Xylaria arbuscula]|nr:hypothetical protein F4678DRAFT_464470 [Xylaria arbuscula]
MRTLSRSHSDSPESQALFLNFRNPPRNGVACTIRGVAVDSVMSMLGATTGFIQSLSLAQKKAIVFLASYAVDWRACPVEFKDIVFCFGRAPRLEKCALSGVSDRSCELIKYAEKIQSTRIEPKLAQLHKASYELNRRRVGAMAPRGKPVSKATGRHVSKTPETKKVVAPPSPAPTPTTGSSRSKPKTPPRKKDPNATLTPSQLHKWTIDTSSEDSTPTPTVKSLSEKRGDRRRSIASKKIDGSDGETENDPDGVEVKLHFDSDDAWSLGDSEFEIQLKKRKRTREE